MPDQKKIFLIGMPAIGKSYWGAELAKTWSLQFIDLDKLIEVYEKISINAIFTRFGETGFREREQKYLKRIIDMEGGDVIIATGGGTPCFNHNMKLMKSCGTVIYLKGDIPYIMNNLKNRTETSPLMSVQAEVKTYLEDLLQQRKNIYEEADHILEVKNISLVSFNKIVAACIRQQ